MNFIPCIFRTLYLRDLPKYQKCPYLASIELFRLFRFKIRCSKVVNLNIQICKHDSKNINDNNRGNDNNNIYKWKYTILINFGENWRL